MYKAGHSAVPRTAFPSIQQKQRPSYTSHQYPQFLQKGAEIQTMDARDVTLTYNSVKYYACVLREPSTFQPRSVPMFNKPKMKHKKSLTRTPPSTPSSPLIEQQIEFLHNSWRAFRETPTGEADPTIVTYRRRKDLPPDFEPFNIDRFLAEKLLKELDIDPKFAVF
ncbi:hypothetical protein DICVIV_00354 [Dictyocaulus viviparus]|uniref:Uncharacterized protein n=1 Tax=Dictyocaulus viviparus TaxID=29172 RepID=A0A0D8YFJ5_DICVI|nr:hypothetical protein DICVIV_00354 [Dictyocaulus viviparus]